MNEWVWMDEWGLLVRSGRAEPVHLPVTMTPGVCVCVYIRHKACLFCYCWLFITFTNYYFTHDSNCMRDFGLWLLIRTVPINKIIILFFQFLLELYPGYCALVKGCLQWKVLFISIYHHTCLLFSVVLIWCVFQKTSWAQLDSEKNEPS